MATISEIFRTFSPEYVDRFGDSMPQEHRKAMNAIIDCRCPFGKAECIRL